jgi:hypothetical protein
MDIRFISTAGYDLYGYTETSVSGGLNGGSIEIEYGWQLIAIPVEYGYWSTATHEHVHDGVTIAKMKNYVVDQIDDQYGIDKIEVANTYTGDNQAFYNYVYGSTPESSQHNFQLIYQDNIHSEVSGFWLYSLSVTPMTIVWGVN